MSHAAPSRLHRLPSAALTQADPAASLGAEALGLRLLRHQTKNALQRLIAQVAASDLRGTAAGAALADDLERRICLSARVSDALFGLTERPGPLPVRLGTLCRSTVALMADDVQTIETAVQTAGACPQRLEATVLQVAHEMVTNAVKHGMHMRLTGTVEVVLRSGRAALPQGGVLLEVRDNGWGPELSGFGEGLSTLELMAAQHGGRVELARREGWTAARMHIPGPA